MVKIRQANFGDREAWDRYVLANPEGVGYQLFGWKTAVERAYRFRCPYLVAEEQGNLRGVLPLIHVRSPLSKGGLVSLPYCDVGGALADSDGVSEALLAQAMAVAREIGAGHLETRSSAPAQGSPTGTGKVRMLLELPDGAESLMATFPSKLRSQVRKPGREGLTAVLGGGELIDEFYPIFAENMRDLGSPVHSRKWLEEVVAAFGERCRVGVVRLPDGSAAAAGVILLHNRTVSIPWASSLRRFNRTNANMLLYWAFLSFAADNDYARFDFGRSTPGEGTYRFKQQWGAQPEPLDWVRLRVPSGSAEVIAPGMPSKARELAEALYAKLPLKAATEIGCRVRKYISL